MNWDYQGYNMFKIAAQVLFLFLSGCATKGYAGRELSPSEISTIYFYSQGRLSLNKMMVNEIDQGIFDMGVTVPAGKVTASAQYQLTLYECPKYSEYCFDEVEYGSCRFTLNTEGGHEYGIEIKEAGESVWNRVYDKTTNITAGSGICEKDLGSH